MARACTVAAVAALALLLGACGWHMRGSYELPSAIVPVAVDGEGALARSLERDLRRLGALEGGEPASRLEILDESDDRRVVSVDDDGDVNEFEVRYVVRWQLVGESDSGKGQRVLIAPRTLESSRTYDFDSADVLSKDEEEAARIEAMRDDMVQQILFRLQAWDPGGAAPSGDDDD